MVGDQSGNKTNMTTKSTGSLKVENPAMRTRDRRRTIPMEMVCIF